MKNPYTALVSLNYPLILAAVAAILALTATPEGAIKIRFDVLKPFILEREIGNEVVLKVVLWIVALTVLWIPAFRDYSVFFPTFLRMRVFFDTEGIEHALKMYSSQEREMLNVERNWHAEQLAFMARLNELVEQHGVSTPNVFNTQTSGVGETTFRVRKTRGLQNYYIYESNGEVRFTIPKSDGTTITLYERTELLPTEDSYLDGSIYDVYVKHTKIMRPRFNQYVQVHPFQRLRVDELVAVTKIRFWPIIDVGRTLYMLRKPSGTAGGVSLAPIGYAVYEAD